MGLESAQSAQHAAKVQNYVTLFQDVEQCSKGVATMNVINILLTACLFLGARLLIH